MTQRITRAMPVDYDSRTDRIEVAGTRTMDAVRYELSQLQTVTYRIVEPVIGWAPYTHLIAPDSDEALLAEISPWYLVTLR